MFGRILAVVIAVALIAGAFVYRDRSDGGLSSIGREPLRLVCSTELAEVCNAAFRNDTQVRVRVEPAWLTFDRLASADPTDVDIDGWLATGPWPQMLDAARERAQRQPLFAEPSMVGAAPLTAVIYRDKLAASGCGESPTWQCIATAAGAGLRVTMPSPDTEAVGTLVAAAATGGLLGEPEFVRNDVEGETLDRMTQFIRNAERHRADTGSLQILLVNPAALDGWLDIAPPVSRVVSGAASERRDAVAVVTPSPRAVVTVNAAGVDTDPGRRLASRLESQGMSKALSQLGWTGEAPPDEGEDGLPSPGVLIALRELLS